ncbi:glycoside hydrolase superfamily [Umbelopsis sp. PMI_123]|nr:glycoside hydrolase superfamily [Umbelopsis sp. PMI_123]
MKQRFPSYTYINLDSGWSDGVDEFGRWTYRKDLFPNGLRAVSDYLAKNGHKLGLYILPGIRAEAAVGAKRIYNTDLRIADVVVNRREGNGFKGSTFAPDLHNSFVQQYYDSIADQFAEWGVGYVKVDGCGPGGGDPWYPFQSPDNRECLTMMSKGFHRHNIWMEISWYLDPSYAEDWVNICNGVRIYVDIESYSTSTMTTPYRIFQRMALSEKWAATGLVGGEYGMFVDLDIVAVGMTVKDQCIDGLWDDSIRLSYISFWALVSSVFCLGADPRAIPDTYVKMLNHPDILYIHQSGIMAQPIGSGDASKNRKQVWWKKLPDGRTCVGLFNAHLYPVIYGVSHEVSFSFADIGLTSGTLFDVWEGTDLGHHTDVYKVILTSGACQVLFVTPSE